MTQATGETVPQVFYNGACPVCRREIDHYRRRAARVGVAIDWRDVSREPQALASAGLDGEALRRRMHARESDGRLLSGVDAFQVVWRRLPGYRWLARLVSRPALRPAAARLYDLVARALYAWDRRRRRRGR